MLSYNLIIDSMFGVIDNMLMSLIPPAASTLQQVNATAFLSIAACAAAAGLH
jgi:hypothetical protein